MYLILSEDSPFKTVSPSDTLVELLGRINPAKRIYWAENDEKKLTIDTRNFLWPLKIKDNLIDQVFPSFKSVLSELESRFDIIEVITDSSAYESSESLHFYTRSPSPKGTAIVLSLLETKQLYDCLQNEGFNDECHCALKFDGEEHFTVRFPNGLSLSELMSLTATELNRDMTGLLAVDPVIGKILEPETILDSRFTFIFFLTNPARFDLPFPFWKNRTMDSVKTIELTDPGCRETPCCNCLSCVKVCPSVLSPHILYHLLIHEEIEGIDQFHINSCIRCGRCSIVCPSNIPLSSGIIDYLLIKESEENDEDS